MANRMGVLRWNTERPPAHCLTHKSGTAVTLTSMCDGRRAPPARAQRISPNAPARRIDGLDLVRTNSPSSNSDSNPGSKNLPPKLHFHSADVGWRPTTLQPPFLVAFAIITALLIVAIEYMLQRSKANGAVAFTSSPSFAGFVDYCFVYGPLVLAVLYGLAWESVDHNIKCLEPYFQLSKPGGATVEHSLLLNYSYVIAVFAPFIAIRKSIQSSVSQRFIAGVHQNPQSSCTTFQSAHKTPPHSGELWTAKSTLYEARLDCVPGVLEVLEQNGSAVVQFSSEAANPSFILNDGKIGDLINYNSPYSSFMLHERLIRALNGDIVRLQKDALVGFFGRQSKGAPSKTNSRPLSWASRLAKSSVIFCTPVHEQQEVEVTVDAKLQQIQNITELESPKVRFDGLNITYWQDHLLGYTCSASTAGFNLTTNDRLFNVSSDRPCQWGLPNHLSQMRKRPAFRTLLEYFTDGTPTDIVLVRPRDSVTCVKPNVLRDFEGAEFMRFKQLVASLKRKGHRYFLHDQKVAVCNEDNTDMANESGRTIYKLVPGEESQAPGENNQETVDPDNLDRSKIVLEKPWSLAVQIGVLATVVIIGGVILLGVFYQRSNTQNGFREPASQFLYEFYSSYLPTICALLFSGYLTLLATHVTLTYPFIQLGRGEPPPHRCVTITSSSHRALKTRNFLLASLSVSILLANVLAVALSGLFHKDLISLEGTGNVALKWPVESLSEFNGTLGALFEGVSDIDAEFFCAATGVGLGFRQLPWTTDSFYYVPFSDQNPAINHTNYTAEIWGIGVDITYEVIPEEEVRIWNSPVNDSSVPPRATFSYPTFRDAINTTLIIENSKVFDFRMEKEPLQRYLEVEEFGGNGTSIRKQSASEFYELVPAAYPPTLSGPWKFFGGWFRYEFATRNVKIDRSSDRDLVGDTIDGPTTYISMYTAIRCSPAPKLVRSVVLADPDGAILNSNDTTIPAAISGASNMTGLPGVLDSFQDMMNRITGKSRDVKANDISESVRKRDPRPSNWLSFLIHREAQEKNAVFDLYSYPTQSAQAMETVYKRLFAIYVSLHADRIMGADKAQTRDATFVRHTVNRVFMTPVAFFVSVVLLVVFVPVVAWTGAVEDVAGMAGAREKERERALNEVGHRYGYGWFETETGDRHFGIDREPLLKSDR
ncbi:hypothetical protein K440DRAFT_646265 [Wilcoxina mikolae CBS 423.85]|nr:hypothetical protein K440DRAFT_646265 [Wilcoxina mikolae CBS 423.85]